MTPRDPRRLRERALLGVLIGLVVVETGLHRGGDSPHTYGNTLAYGFIQDYVIRIDGFLVNLDSGDQADLSLFLASGIGEGFRLVSRIMYSHLVGIVYPWLGMYRAALLVNAAAWALGTVVMYKLPQVLGFSRAAGVLAAFFTATSVGYIAIVGQVLSYPAGFTTVALVLYLWAAADRAHPQPRHAIPLAGLVMGAGLLTYELLNLAVFVVLALLCRRWVAQAAVFAGLAVLPWLLLRLVVTGFGLSVDADRQIGEAMAARVASLTAAPLAAGALALKQAGIGVGRAFVFVPALLAVVGWLADRDLRRKFAALAFVVLMATVVALGPFPAPRSFFQVFPVVYTFAAVGSLWLGEVAAQPFSGGARTLVHRFTVAAAVVAVLVSAHLTVYRYYYYG